MAMRVRVCAAVDVVEGKLRAFVVAGVTWPVIVTRLGGEIVAVPGVCPHEDVALFRGQLRGGAIVCPGHAYEFDLRSGRCKHDPTLRLRRYPTTLHNGDVFVELL